METRCVVNHRAKRNTMKGSLRLATVRLDRHVALF